MKKLAPRQAAFVREYLVDLNATQAAIRAGYKEKTARAQGSRLLTNAAVEAALKGALEKRNERLELKADDVLRELLTFARFDPARAFAKDGSMLPLHEMPEDVRRAISSIEVDEFDADDGPIGRVKKVKFWSKPHGLEMLGRHLKLFTDKVEAAGADGGPLEIVIRKESA